MPMFIVRFRGLIFKSHLESLDRAGLVLKGSEPSPDSIFGETIHSVAIEAASEEEALETVERTIGIDSVNFSDWEAGPDESAGG
ncbi:MAG: hypothetical protein M3335_00110 [Actinomycetota bacterium]|nr:hypothetical protein [Actinomycetota bacterium]